MGSKKMEESRESANQLVWFVGTVSIIMVIIYLIKPLILNGLFGQITNEVHKDASTCLMITAISIPYLSLYNAPELRYSVRWVIQNYRCRRAESTEIYFW
ncbi:MATE family efflux transporter [Aeribacillus sp. FSL K6-2848]|uniref:MATE family efflux transporter n=1 Tax=Aeribacillus sp. FSL K6-2848 TaxID=2954612 RepID=UPI0030FA2EC1